MSDRQVTFKPSSDQSLLIYFGDKIEIETNRRIVKLLRLLDARPISSIRNLHPSYCSLLVKFDGLLITHAELETILRDYLNRLEEVSLPEPRLIEIPVCYGGDLGPDLDGVAELHSMTPGQVIDLHTSAVYVVYFLGFVPGFAYLGGLPEALATPRLPAPRKKVPPGSVGIAGNQTGVYPFATPGGWRLLGRTPVSIFQPDRADMSLLSIGDQVRFVPISRKQFEESCR